jgi:hypothetical protein
MLACIFASGRMREFFIESGLILKPHPAKSNEFPSQRPHGLTRAISTVAQIFNLPYRRIEFCNA